MDLEASDRDSDDLRQPSEDNAAMENVEEGYESFRKNDEAEDERIA